MLLCVLPYIDIMKILYTYDRPHDDGADIPADKVFADTKRTGRVERTALIDGQGLHKGDTLYLRQVGQIGHGAEAPLMRAKVAAIGADIVLAPLPDAPKADTAIHWRPSDDVQAHCLTLWYSALPTKHVLARTADITGRKISRDQMYRLGGPRDGSKKPKN